MERIVEIPAHKQKSKIMKKIIVMALTAVSLAACNDGTDNATVDTKDTTSTIMSTTTISTSYTPAEGDVTYRDKKVRVWKNGQWVDADGDVELESGVVVHRTGRVKKEDKEIVLEDGEVVNRSGNFFDKTGHAIEKAWNATKEGVKDAGKAVGKAAEKVGEKAKDAVTDDDKE